MNNPEQLCRRRLSTDYTPGTYESVWPKAMVYSLADCSEMGDRLPIKAENRLHIFDKG